MNVIDKFLKQYSYKFNKGYPDMNDEQDILLLESILKEEFNIVAEVVTSATEDLHEVFIAMFLAGHNGITDINNFKTVSWDSEVNKLQNLERKQDHIDILNRYFAPENIDKNLNKYWDIYDDAEVGAELIKQYLGPIKSSQRVFDAGDSGKKIKADVVIKDNDGPLSISLKYGKGQMNSLSASEVMALLYDIEDLGMGSGFLGQLYKLPEYKKAFDQGVKDYLTIVLNNYKTSNKYQDLRQVKNTDKSTEEILDDFKNNQLNNITWSDYRKSPKILKKAVQYAYEVLDPDKKQEFIQTKQRAINRSIEDYLSKLGKSQITNNQDSIRQLISYILGPDEEHSYLYAADLRKGGGKIFFLPSKKQIDSNEYILSAEPKTGKDGSESANYEYLITVKDKKTGKNLFQFDVLLRFGDGQWTSDVSQKGAYFKVFEENFGKVFPPI